MVPGANQDPSGFAINEIKCPSCNGPLDLPDGADIATCKFCGSTVHVSYRRKETGIEQDGTVRDSSTGYGLFRVKAQPGWRVTGASLERRGSVSRPYVPQVQFADDAGGSVTLQMGEAGIRNSAGMNALLSMYGGHLAGVSTANYAEVPNPLNLADAIAQSSAASVGASRFLFLRQLSSPNMEQCRQNEYTRLQRLAQAEGASFANPFVGVVLRVYELEMSGQSWKMAVFVELGAAKDASGLGEGFGTGLMDGIGGLMGSIGNLFGGGKQAAPYGAPQQQEQPQGVMGFLRGGGLVGKMQRDRQAQSYQQPIQQMGQAAPMGQMPMQPQPQKAPSQGASWCIPDFQAYTGSGTIAWSVTFIATFLAPADRFDGELEKSFLPFVSSLEVHPDVDRLTIQVVQEEAGRVQMATQGQLARNQAAFDAQQAAHRQQQAAFDSYNQSISDARDAQHRQFMSSSQAQFDHHAPDFSEAIRGVNTYTTSDGREVEVSVHADRAFENQAGDVIGTSNSFEPGASWTEIPRT